MSFYSAQEDYDDFEEENEEETKAKEAAKDPGMDKMRVEFKGLQVLAKIPNNVKSNKDEEDKNDLFISFPNEKSITVEIIFEDETFKVLKYETPPIKGNPSP